MARHLLRWTTLGAIAGLLAGVAAFVFLEVLDVVTETRVEHGWLVWFLPLGGLAVGLAYHRLGGRARRGTALLLDELHDPTDWVPRRMAPLVLVGTWATHLVGGSAGREGTGLQMSGSLADAVSRRLGLGRDDRRRMLTAGLAGGFGAVFGVPAAGVVFALEVRRPGADRRGRDALVDSVVGAVAAAVVGDLVVRSLGHEHSLAALGALPAHSVSLWLRVVVAGLAFGAAAAGFVLLTHRVERVARRVPWPPLRPALGRVVVGLLVVVAGRDYLGLSLPLRDAALTGAGVAAGAFALKALFTAVTVGSGFPGGEVTPLVVIGATLGDALAPVLHLPGPMLAAVGSVAVLGAALEVPLAAVVMGVELFGLPTAIVMAFGCVAAGALRHLSGVTR